VKANTAPSGVACAATGGTLLITRRAAKAAQRATASAMMIAARLSTIERVKPPSICFNRNCTLNRTASRLPVW
jgi:hypothetical protein